MQDTELKKIWESYDQKIAEARVLNMQSWALNFRCFETMQQQRAEKKLTSLARFNLWAVLLGICWAGFLSLLVWGNHFSNPFFSVSVGIIALFNLYAIVAYTLHTIQIRLIRYDAPVTETQQQLARLQKSTFRSTRILWLQLPFYSTWFWHSSWILTNDASFWLIAFPITLVFVLLAVYLYRNIHPRNMNKKWVYALMMSGPEYRNLADSMGYLEEIEDFKKDRC